MTPPSRDIAKSFQAALVAGLRVFARPALLVMLVLCLQCFAVSTVAKAQHCGRSGYVPEWNQSLMSWESQAQVVSDKFDAETGRIRTSQCEGPLCSRQQPEPFSSGSSGAVFGGPMPWKCNAILFAVPNVETSSRLSVGGFVKVNNPIIQALFKPPWFV